MKIKVETEAKYYCMEPERLISLALDAGFKEISNAHEEDEYFTDINSEFIANRTCLRIRKRDKKMEITYKGKSTSLLSDYCKLENNISVSSDSYENFVSLFSALGFYSYCNVVKERLTYFKNDSQYEYSIMIDKLPNIGGFIEFEIISDREISSKEALQKALDEFVDKFNDLNLKEVSIPYRDIAANYIYTKLVSSHKSDKLFIDLDKELAYYEKDFFKKYRDRINEKCSTNIKWGEYKLNRNLDIKIAPFVDEYLENIIFDSNNILVVIELLNKIDYKKYFITKINEVFFTHLFGKLGIPCNNIVFLDDCNIIKVLKRENIDITTSIIINESDIKSIINSLLIMINHS